MTTTAAATARIVSPESQSHLDQVDNNNRSLSFPIIRNTKSKDKAYCEYYNEELDLEDGDLPSLLKRRNKSSHNSSNNSSINSSTSRSQSNSRSNVNVKSFKSRSQSNSRTSSSNNDTRSPFRLRRSVTLTPTPSSPQASQQQPTTRNTSRSSTPVIHNTNTEKKSFWKKKERRVNDGEEGGEGGERGEVQIETPILTLEDKRKHRAFWNQFESQNSDGESSIGDINDINNINNNNKVVVPVVEKGGHVRFKNTEMNNYEIKNDTTTTTPTTMTTTTTTTPTTNSKTNIITPRQNEILVNEDDDEDYEHHGKDFYNMVINMCTDCNWALTPQPDNKNKSIINMNKKKKDYTLNLDLQEQNNTTSSMVVEKQKRSSSSSNTNADANTVTVTSKGTKKSSTSTQPYQEPQNYENTKIEVEYEYDEMDNNNNTNVEEEEEVTDPKFLQLNQTGTVAVYARPNDKSSVSTTTTTTTTQRQQQQQLQQQQQQQQRPNPQSQPTIIHDEIEPMPSDERGGYTIGRSKSWSAPQKNAYLQAMAQKAREDFQKTKGTKISNNNNNNIHHHVEMKKKKEEEKSHDVTMKDQDYNDNDNDDDTLIGILGENTSKKVSSKTIDWTKYNWTPSEKRKLFYLVKSEGMSPDEATNVIIAERIKKTIDEDDADIASTVPMRRSKTYTVGSNSRQVAITNDLYDVNLNEKNSHVDSTILSNLRNKPGFNRVVNTNLQDQPIELPVEDTVRRSLPPVDQKVDTSSNNNVKITTSPTIISSKKKKGSKNGPKWHQMDDDDDDKDDNGAYQSNNNNFAPSTNNQKPFRNTSQPGDDIFNFDPPEEDQQPLGSVKIDPYHDSCDVSILGSTMAGDHTVMSGKSYYTTATNSSAWSTSTRRRHRGAAKNRLPDNNDKKPVGWLDTIKEAAVKNNREWNPESGWVDYNYNETQDNDSIPTVDPKPEYVKVGKLKPPKKIKVKKSKSFDSGTHKDSGAEWGMNAGNIEFPSEWEMKRNNIASGNRDDDGSGSAVIDGTGNSSTVTDVINNNFHRNEDVEVRSNAETEIVSNKVDDMIRPTLIRSIPETIGEDSSEEDEEEEEDNHEEEVDSQKQDIKQYDSEDDDSSRSDPSVQEDNKKVDIPSRESVTSRLTSDDDAELTALKNSLSSAQAKAREFLEKIKFTSVADVDRELEEKKEDSTAYFSSRKSKSDDIVVEDVQEGEEDSGFDEDGDDFCNVVTSFEFGDDEKDPDLEEDGFKVIASTLPRNGFGGHDKEEKFCDDDKSVKSSTSLMSSKAMEWRKKVETSKRSISSQRGERQIVEEPTKHRVNVFVSAADENSTFEMREKPTILNVDEDDTLFDFGISEGHLRKNVEVKSPPQRKHGSQSRRSRHTVDNADEFSEITTPSVDMSKPTGTFFDRLQSCNAVMVGSCEPERRGSGLPNAHLQFLRNANDVQKTSKSDNRAGGLINILTSPGLCGRPETVEETDEEFLDLKKSNGGKNVASSYLEAINAGKANNISVKRTTSGISSGSTNSETWQRFLDKRAVALSSKRSNSSGEVSKAAQEYASKRVEEIMKNGDRGDKIRFTRPPSSGRQRNTRQDEVMSKRDAVKAAEDLAAARVEAMMAMTPRTLSHDESEI